MAKKKKKRGDNPHSTKFGVLLNNLHPFKPHNPANLDSLAKTQKMLPKRYSTREEGKDRFLKCVESPNLSVFVDRKFCISGTAARKYPECTLFLDGAAKGEPFMDVQRKIYNLDHHEGCVRPFTLATCEQAMILILKGLDLSVGDWSIYANEPDLDTILAIWVIMNHTRLAGEDSVIRQKVMPLLRLEGIIDSHGLDMKSFTGFPDSLQESTLKQIESIRGSEMEFKKEGIWGSMDELEYVVMQLKAIDELFYSSRDFVGIGKIEELFRIKIGEEKIAIACKSDEGIYETEEILKKNHGARLGLIFLQKDEKNYTVRQVDPFLPTSMKRLFHRLNLMDPHANASHNWAGAEEIGGSPRGVGTGLNVNEIKKICSWVYNKRTTSEKFHTILKAAGTAVVVFLIAYFSTMFLVNDWDSWLFNPSDNVYAPVYFHGGIMVLASIRMIFDRGHPSKFFGFSRPGGWCWMALFPVVLLTSFFFGMVPVLHLEGNDVLWSFTLVFIGPVAWEFLFRGVLWGIMQDQFHTMSHRGSWFLSVPNMTTTLISAFAMVLFFQIGQKDIHGFHVSIWLSMAVCLIFSLCMGIARERSESLLPGITLGVTASLLAAYLVRAIAI
jgi:membrane protease YdiL (CAAX protease family)